jgi:DNA-binding MarR family transcriptional regulator
MANAKAKMATADASGREAWNLLMPLVYPPPFLDVARRFDLRPASMGAVRILDRPRTMSEMATMLRCDNSNVTGIVDGLEEKGLALREPSPDDRRVKLIALSPEGRRLHNRLTRAMERPPAWIEDLSEVDRLALRDLLQRAAGAGR